MHWTRACAALLALSIVGTFGCSPGKSTAPSNGTIGCTLQNLTNPFFKVIADSLAAEAEKYGYEVHVVSGEMDVAKQQNQIKDFIVNGVAAIVLNPKDSKAIGPAVVEANKAGIPVFTVDIKCLDPAAKITSHVGTDNYGGGKLAGEAMIEALGAEGGDVAILDFKEVESCQERVRGFKEVVEAHNKTASGKINIVTELPSKGARDQGYRAAEDALQAHPGLRGVFAINDPAALGARAALEKAGKADAVKIVGFDGQPEGKQAIKDGKIYADPIQFPDKMGVLVAQSIAKHFGGEAVPASQDIPTALYRQADALKDPDLK